MSAQFTNPSSDAENQRQLDHELRDLFSHLRQSQNPHEEDNGVRIITLAGTNTGATLKSELGGEPNRPRQHHHWGITPASAGEEDDGDDEGETEDMGTLVNSNFQAVNNSIMLSGSFSSNDPGVRVEISGGGDHQHRSHRRHGHRTQQPREEARNGRSQERIYQPIAGTTK